jgi:hypothetical protein
MAGGPLRTWLVRHQWAAVWLSTMLCLIILVLVLG